MAPLCITQVLAVASLASLAACTLERGDHPESDVPEEQTRIHQPEYEGDEIKAAEFEPPAREAGSAAARGETPMVVAPEWSLAGPDAEWRITSVVLDVGLAEVCSIASAEAHFDFDSAKLDAEDQARIAKIARCFTDGPLAGRDLVIVGHADPRGTDAYNRELGMSRAEAVARALSREGLANTRIDLESFGEDEAHADPDEWPDDRRVDLHTD